MTTTNPPTEADYQAAIDALVKAKVSAVDVITKDEVKAAAIAADAQAHATWESDTRNAVSALQKLGLTSQAQAISDALNLPF